jgi:hypothetical protein
MIRSSNKNQSPYSYATVVTLSDTVNIADSIVGTKDAPRALYVLTSGNLNILPEDNNSPVVIPVTAGQLLNIACKRVYATSSTATCLALY